MPSGESLGKAGLKGRGGGFQVLSEAIASPFVWVNLAEDVPLFRAKGRPFNRLNFPS
jgi:hypothetical protein